MSKQEKKISEMTQEIVATFKKYEQTRTVPWTYDIAAKDLIYQIGSLMKPIMQLRGERYAHNASEVELKEKIGDELADILAEVLFIAHELNIDIQDSWQKMLQSDESKIEKRK